MSGTYISAVFISFDMFVEHSSNQSSEKVQHELKNICKLSESFILLVIRDKLNYDPETKSISHFGSCSVKYIFCLVEKTFQVEVCGLKRVIYIIVQHTNSSHKFFIISDRFNDVTLNINVCQVIRN
ncbi:CLUMA_CG018331, isoform A [Clunio marinus]|uniref:CLUMA_CG018331, isoform A n=1 Tax=Clunio marinus TaxID=568069 RepID=A0A1J1J1K6_9DIPT|nr:CLUMA_CG018331, isoform A [Clunio marinus]